MEYRSNYAVRFILIGLCLAAIAVLAVMLFRTPSKRPGESSAAAPETTAAPPATVPETAESVTTPEETTVQKPESTAPVTEPPRQYEYATDVSRYLEFIDTDDRSYLILANRSHALGSKYVPEGLTKLNGYGNVTLRHTAAMAFEAMYKEMKALGMADVVVSSSYRDYNYQNKLYNRYIKEELARLRATRGNRRRQLSTPTLPAPVQATIRPDLPLISIRSRQGLRKQKHSGS